MLICVLPGRNPNCRISREGVIIKLIFILWGGSCPNCDMQDDLTSNLVTLYPLLQLMDHLLSQSNIGLNGHSLVIYCV